jgi:glucosyl-3-phosphoglycerate synthase
VTFIPIPTWPASDFDTDRLVRAKGGTRISVCLPARDEAATVGQVVGVVVDELVERRPLVDEVLVVDDGSVDGTARAARLAGARVVAANDVLPEQGAGTGKGEALWKSLAACEGDLVVWCDADLRRFRARSVSGLLGPLLTEPSVAFVKGSSRRSLDGRPDEGGRVTQLLARPLLSLLFPHLGGVRQPLAGEYAGRREVLEQVPFAPGYGVDLGLLIDVAALAGVEALAQVDLGDRLHRNRSLAELGPEAEDVLRTALSRAGMTVPGDAGAPRDRPPLASVAGYRRP